MITHDEDREPMVDVEGYGQVHAATVECVSQLLDDGYDVDVNCSTGALNITPAIAPDLHEHLAASPTEIEASLVHYARHLLASDLRAWR